MHEPSFIDMQRVRGAFSRHARDYVQHANVQRRIEQALLERVLATNIQPKRILDLGCGPGFALKALKKQWPKAEVIGIDLSASMLKQAKKQQRWRRGFQLIQANANALPLATQSIDLVFSSLCLQWLIPMNGALAEIRRVLKPSGAAHLAILGQGSLTKLHEAAHQSSMNRSLIPLPDIMDVGALLQQSGLSQPVLDRQAFHQQYANPQAYLKAIRGIGAGNARADSRKGMQGKTAWKQFMDTLSAHQTSEGIQACYDTIFAYAQGTPKAFDSSLNQQGTAYIDASHIPRRTR